MGETDETDEMDEKDEYCRPASLEDLKGLLASLHRQQADYLLIGGYALFVHVPAAKPTTRSKSAP